MVRLRQMKQRWTISKIKEARGFMGWSKLIQIVKAVDVGLRDEYNHVLISNDMEKAEGRALVATLFETGGRVSEVLRLRPKDFKSDDNFVYVTLQLAKRFVKVGKVAKYRATDETKLRWDTEQEALSSGHPYSEYVGWLTRARVDYRISSIPRHEPLVKIMLPWVDYIGKQDPDGLLFLPHLENENSRYIRAYRICVQAGQAVGLETPPHRFRAERGCQLALEYGLSPHELAEWFGWRDMSMSFEYISMAPKIYEKRLKPAARTP